MIIGRSYLMLSLKGKHWGFFQLYIMFAAPAMCKYPHTTELSSSF